MSKPFILKNSILYNLTQLKVVQDWVQDRQLVLFFAKGNQKILDISFGTALIRIHSGNVLNHIILGCENN